MTAPADILRLLEPPDDFDARPVVAALVSQARGVGASDVHLRPNGRAVEVLARRDGVLQHQFDLPSPIYDRLLVGLKNMARLASFRRSAPQDGRMTIDEHDVRVATTPTHFGEKVVLRFVRGEEGARGLDEIVTDPGDRSRLLSAVEQPQGLFLATGPAGSGKTTTLYALIRHLMARHRSQVGPMRGATLNVITLEDPIECVIPEITQTPIIPEAGMTFASGLRSMLRQDPEVLLVGEIRDAETAAAAVQCGLTGHLVLSTLHARDAVGVIPRLRELGVEPYLLGASLVGVMYQRLVRALCSSCRKQNGESWMAVGCSACDATGYRGRVAACEVLTVDDGLRHLVLEQAPLVRLQDHAREAGMRTLRECALRLAAAGVTSREEVQRTCP